jgi:hypothetical protein
LRFGASGAFLRGGAGVALATHEFHGAQDSFFERGEIIGAQGQRGWLFRLFLFLPLLMFLWL